MSVKLREILTPDIIRQIDFVEVYYCNTNKPNHTFDFICLNTSNSVVLSNDNDDYHLVLILDQEIKMNSNHAIEYVDNNGREMLIAFYKLTPLELVQLQSVYSM